MDAQDDPPKAEVSPTDPPASISTSAELPGQPLSKNAQKRLAKAARVAELKKERRAYEKEKRKEKKRQLAVKRAAGEMDGDEGEDDASRKKARTEGPRTPFDARIVVDLGFDSMMSDNVGRLVYLILMCDNAGLNVRCTSFLGDKIFDVTTRVYVQREPQSTAPVLCGVVHFPQWADTYTVGEPEQCSVQAVA